MKALLYGFQVVRCDAPHELVSEGQCVLREVLIRRGSRG